MSRIPDLTKTDASDYHPTVLSVVPKRKAPSTAVFYTVALQWDVDPEAVDMPPQFEKFSNEIYNAYLDEAGAALVVTLAPRTECTLQLSLPVGDGVELVNAAARLTRLGLRVALSTCKVKATFEVEGSRDTAGSFVDLLDATVALVTTASGDLPFTGSDNPDDDLPAEPVGYSEDARDMPATPERQSSQVDRSPGAPVRRRPAKATELELADETA